MTSRTWRTCPGGLPPVTLACRRCLPPPLLPALLPPSQPIPGPHSPLRTCVANLCCSKKRGSGQKAPARKRQARGRGRAASEDEDDSDDGDRLEIDEEELIRDEDDRKRCAGPMRRRGAEPAV